MVGLVGRRRLGAEEPLVDGRLAVRRDRLVHRQPSQRAEAPPVEPPEPRNGNVRQVELLQDDPRRAYRALEHRRVCHVERVPHLLQHLRGLRRLLYALGAQVRICPPGETALGLPVGAAVLNQRELADGRLGEEQRRHQG
eukprot:1240571-Prymnesium_polylepis.1